MELDCQTGTSWHFPNCAVLYPFNRSASASGAVSFGRIELYPGAEGWALVDEWSTAAREAHGCNGTLRKQSAKWRQFRDPGQRGSVGAGTLVYYAKRHGWRPAAPPRFVVTAPPADRRPAVRLAPQEAGHAR